MVSIVAVTLWTLAFFIMTFLLCGPSINFLWTPGNSAKCWLIYPYFLGTTISDFLLDVLILCLPIPKVSCPPDENIEQMSETADLDSSRNIEAKDRDFSRLFARFGVSDVDSQDKEQALTNSV